MSELRHKEPHLEERTHRELKEDQGILSVRTLFLAHDQEVSLFNHEYMDPIEEAWEQTEFPPVFQQLIKERQEAMKDYWTLRATFENPEWKQELWIFIEDYLTREGAWILEKIRINDLRRLTPSQAIQLTTKIVVQLMKYDYASLDSGETKTGNTREDTLSVLEILKEGRASKTKEDWEGNGICRNFAAVEHGVFEALKNQQEPGSHLEQMENVVVVGTEHVPYSVERAALGDDTHAWNIYLLAPKKNEVHVSIIDPTWAAIHDSQKTDQTKTADYTFERMEGFIYSLAGAVTVVEPESWNGIARFYSSMLETFDGRTAIQAQEKRDYYAYRFLKLIEAVPIEQQTLPEIDLVLTQIEDRYMKLLQRADTVIASHLGSRLRVLSIRRKKPELIQRLKIYVQSRKET